MTFTTRHWAIRKLGMSYGNLEVAQDHLIEIGVKYYDDYPEVFDQISVITAAIESVKAVISDYREGF